MAEEEEGAYRRQLQTLLRRQPRRSGVDPQLPIAMRDIMAIFAREPEAVLYGRQIELRLERDHFHWITTKALGELVDEGELLATAPPVPGGRRLPKFYWLPTNRYWRRKALTIGKLVAQFSTRPFAEALGRHGEMMVSAGLAGGQFHVAGQDVRQWNGIEWTATGHNLDRIFVRDGIPYGAEIKNSLEYMDVDELRIKIGMCLAFGVRPLFVVRFAPKTYIYAVHRLGGFTLVVGKQLYPFGHLELAERVKGTLGLPVDCPRSFEAGAVQRLVSWHERHRDEPIRHDPDIQRDFNFGIRMITPTAPRDLPPAGRDPLLEGRIEMPRRKSDAKKTPPSSGGD